MPRLLSLALLVTLAGAARAQGTDVGETLSLQEALRLAIERNGTLRASALDVRAAESRVRQARAAFSPTVTPTVRYNTDLPGLQIRRTEGLREGGAFTRSGVTTGVASSYRLFDLGQRSLTLRATQQAGAAQEATARQTLRTTLFTVHEQFLDTLRAQELQRVADAQVARANEILRQTEFGASDEVGQFPRKDILQARADALNARVQALVARNRTATTSATLKATIGLEAERPLPALERTAEPTQFPSPGDLNVLVAEGVQNRPDLASRRRTVESLRANERRARIESGLTVGVDLSLDLQFSPDYVEQRALGIGLSYPLFDGGLRREQAREIGLSVRAERAELLQAERIVRAEVESAYAELTQNAERVQASRLAAEAARLNYAAALESRQAGASDLIAVLTAQVSLVTAESNLIEATYDYTIAEVRMNLVTGRSVPGEELRAER